MRMYSNPFEETLEMLKARFREEGFDPALSEHLLEAEAKICNWDANPDVNCGQLLQRAEDQLERLIQ